MATVKASLSHTERTSTEPRDPSLHPVILTKISRVNSSIRLYQLTPVHQPVTFLPGQWLDVYVPSIPKAGGFTITSSPSKPYLELAVQQSPSNPPAAWLWQEEQGILGKELQVRVGGSFVWPPPAAGEALNRAVFVAGGVGINPLMSMVSRIEEEKRERGRLGYEVEFLYASKRVRGAGNVLFLDRLQDIFRILGEEGNLKIFLTGDKMDGDQEYKIEADRRINDSDLIRALGPTDQRSGTVCYVCGVPGMTDEFVAKAQGAEGMQTKNVLSEKWW